MCGPRSPREKLKTNINPHTISTNVWSYICVFVCTLIYPYNIKYYDTSIFHSSFYLSLWFFLSVNFVLKIYFMCVHLIYALFCIFNTNQFSFALSTYFILIVRENYRKHFNMSIYKAIFSMLLLFPHVNWLILLAKML